MIQTSLLIVAAVLIYIGVEHLKLYYFQQILRTIALSLAEKIEDSLQRDRQFYEEALDSAYGEDEIIVDDPDDPYNLFGDYQDDGKDGRKYGE